jgi:UPF0755 protein
MVKKIFALCVVAAIVAGVATAVHEYRVYTARKAARLERLKEQAEDVQVTTIEGWTVKDIAQQLEKSGLTDADTFMSAAKRFDLSGYPLIAETKPDRATLEGFLFPDTYRFNKKTTPEAILDKMLTDFTERSASMGVHAGQGNYRVPGYDSLTVSGNDAPGLSFYQLLTLASIVEKESSGKGGAGVSAADERATIAGIFYNRLAKGQSLESDATINYVTGRNTPAVDGADLAINSPYNTYKYPGLPPTPICNPSLASLTAVLHPIKTDYYYFFHKQPSGEVVFSNTFDEHSRKLRDSR